MLRSKQLLRKVVWIFAFYGTCCAGQSRPADYILDEVLGKSYYLYLGPHWSAPGRGPSGKPVLFGPGHFDVFEKFCRDHKSRS